MTKPNQGVDMKKPDASEEEEEEELEDHDDSPDEEVEDQLKEAKLADIERILQSDPYSYQAHLDHVDILKSMGDLDRLRLARESFASHYPLAPPLWLAWIRDEQSLVSTSDERTRVMALFERATRDYASVDVWLEFCQFTLGNIGSPEGIQMAREVFERAISSVGLHMAQGGLIWAAYREFESALVGLQSDSEKPAQLKRIDDIFKRELAVPLLGMDQTMAEYETWSTVDFKGVVERHVVEKFKKAKIMMNAREPMENEVLREKEDGHLDAYRRYLDFELKENHPPRIQCLFERRITDHCLEPIVWVEYLQELWVSYLRSLERYERPGPEIVKCFETALSAGLADVTHVWLVFLSFKRRALRFDQHEKKEDEEKDVQEMRQLFGKALEQVVTLGCDPTCRIARLWTAMESDLFGSIDSARNIWSDIMAVVGAQAQFWLEFLTMEKTFGDTKHLRKLYPRALDKVQDWPHLVGDLWIQFELEEGTLDQIELAETRVAERVKLIPCQKELDVNSSPVKVDKRKERDRSKRREKRKNPTETPNNSQSGSSGPVVKKAKVEKEPASFKAPLPVSPSKLESNSPDRPVKVINPPPGFKGEIKPPPGFKGDIKPPPGFNDQIAPPPGFKGEIKPPPGFKGDIKPPPGFNDQIAPPPGFEESSPAAPEKTDKTDKIARTVFLSNLDFSVDEKRLYQIMSSSGKVVDVRLVKNYAGKSKGFAYVEFHSRSSAQEALARDNELLDGRPIFISEFNPGKDGHQFKYNTGLEKNKLFVKGFGTNITKEKLGDIFGEHGPIKEVRLVTYRNGHSKGIAFVEYEKESDAQTALLKTDGTTIEDKEISVAISNPPERKGSQGQPSFASETHVRSLGGGKKETGPRGRGRVQVAFVPRVVQNSSKNAANNSKADDLPSSKSNGSTVKSNEDFRNLILKR
ncbi:hypothetical protein TCAL_04845 [Tigriopus californicus]|uniref:RRM domain-containing protein n=1 Tax=Tigriopus californicus TaxID=6832 RepID=A0A553NX93_TIGCA|nr:hypothetical protein TCAL_04845 [Tigriopus californicus]